MTLCRFRINSEARQLTYDCLTDYFISSGKLFCFDEERRVYHIDDELSLQIVETDQRAHEFCGTIFLLEGAQYGFDAVGRFWSCAAEGRWSQVLLFSSWEDALWGLIEAWEPQSKYKYLSTSHNTHHQR